MLGIILALQRWRQYLISKQFDILTNHAPNLYILSQQKRSCRQAYWVEVLAEYAANFIYMLGRVHSAPNALSRIPALKKGQILQAVGKCHGVGGWVVSTQHAEFCDQELLEAVHQVQ